MGITTTESEPELKVEAKQSKTAVAAKRKPKPRRKNKKKNGQSQAERTVDDDNRDAMRFAVVALAVTVSLICLTSELWRVQRVNNSLSTTVDYQRDKLEELEDQRRELREFKTAFDAVPTAEERVRCEIDELNIGEFSINSTMAANTLVYHAYRSLMNRSAAFPEECFRHHVRFDTSSVSGYLYVTTTLLNKSDVVEVVNAPNGVTKDVSAMFEKVAFGGYLHDWTLYIPADEWKSPVRMARFYRMNRIIRKGYTSLKVELCDVKAILYDPNVDTGEQMSSAIALWQALCY